MGGFDRGKIWSGKAEMMTPILLDTCAALWSMSGQISDKARGLLDEAVEAGIPIWVSPITAWEIGLLAQCGKFKAPESPQRWFERLVRLSGVRLADMPPAVLLASSFLPGSPPRDPADRIIAATAREYGYVVMTRNRLLLNYADSGYVQAVSC
jgi:PIN domain nuclease of toxin-antitoxin system